MVSVCTGITIHGVSQENVDEEPAAMELTVKEESRHKVRLGEFWPLV